MILLLTQSENSGFFPSQGYMATSTIFVCLSHPCSLSFNLEVPNGLGKN